MYVARYIFGHQFAALSVASCALPMRSSAYCPIMRYSNLATTSIAGWRLRIHGVLAVLCSKSRLLEGRSPGMPEAGSRAKYSPSRIPSWPPMVECPHASRTWLRMRRCPGVAGASACCY